MAFDPIAYAVDAAIIAGPWGKLVTYQRPQGAKFDAVAPFSITATVETSGDMASPSGPIYADVFIQVVPLLPIGPQKGDQITIADAAVQDGIYVVQEIFWDREAGSAHLKVRWLGTGQ